jgi:hypothetical protein
MIYIIFPTHSLRSMLSEHKTTELLVLGFIVRDLESSGW